MVISASPSPGFPSRRRLEYAALLVEDAQRHYEESLGAAAQYNEGLEDEDDETRRIEGASPEIGEQLAHTRAGLDRLLDDALSGEGARRCCLDFGIAALAGPSGPHSICPSCPGARARVRS